MSKLYNPSANAVAIPDLGVEVPPWPHLLDVTYISQKNILESIDLHDLISNATISYVKEITQVGDVVLMSVSEGLEYIELGVTSTQLGTNKPTRPGIVQGSYYGIPTDDPLAPSVKPGNFIMCIPVVFMDRFFNRIGVCVTNPTANSVVRLGVYSNDNGLPGDLLLDAGMISGDTAGNKELPINLRTPNDWIFLAVWCSADIEFMSVTSQSSPFGIVGDDLVNFTRYYSIPLAFTEEDPLPGGFSTKEDPGGFSAASSMSDYPPFVWFRRV